MQGAKEVGSYSSSSSSFDQYSSSSSFASELFGSKPIAPSSSSKNVFSSIFPAPCKVRSEEFPKFEAINARKKYTGEAAGWSIKPGNSEDDRKNNKMRSDQKDASRIYQEQNSQPSNLSSSIFYGGQEIYYSYPNDNRNSASDPFSLENNSGTNDSGSASRGDWWQGSLYY